MRRLAVSLLPVLAAALGGCAVGDVTRVDPGRGPAAARGVYVPVRVAAGVSKSDFVPGGAPLPVFLNRHGGTFHSGSDDSGADTSSVIASTGRTSATLPPYAGDDATWQALVACVGEELAAFDVEVTDSEPLSGPYVEIVVGGTGAELGLGGYAGVAPIDTTGCELIDRAVAFVFSAPLADARASCEMALAVFGHVASLDHSYACDDPMSYLGGCGDRHFDDEDHACGETAARPCICGRHAQNPVAVLREQLGPHDGHDGGWGGGGPSGHHSCGDVDYAGRCSAAGTLTWCQDSELRTLDCAAHGMDCGPADASLGNDCLRRPPPVTDACGGVDFYGECSAEGVLRYCQDGELVTIDCAAIGEGCGYVDDSIGYNCIVPPAADSCGDVDFFGECSPDGTILRYCALGQLQVVDCAALGQSCGLVSDVVGFDCL